MKKLLLASTLIATTFLISCKSNSGGNPTEVLSAFFDAMAKNDMVKAKELATPESQAMFSLMEMGGKDAKKDMGKFDKNEVEFLPAIIDGDNAKVPVKEKKGGETVNFPMKKVNGSWKVAFDKTSIMGMATDKMSEKGINLSDSLDMIKDKMKDLNMDSLGKEIDKGLKDVNMTPEMKEEMNKAMEKMKTK